MHTRSSSPLLAFALLFTGGLIAQSAEPANPEGSKPGEERAFGGVKACWCPAGTFLMGSPREEVDHRPDEEQVKVTLTRGFWMGKYEVTQGEWKRITGKLPGKLTEAGGTGDDFPVYEVNYAQAESFCKQLTELAHKSGELRADWEFHLPTEAQWEYTCRAGTTTATSFGDKLSSKQANFEGKPYNGAEEGPSLKKATKAGSYPANPWGLCDMHGNQFEWCRDWYHAKLPGGIDPDLSAKQGTINRDGTYSRVRRGGAFTDDGKFCRSALRLRYEPERGYDHIGFRVAAVPVGKPVSTPVPRSVYRPVVPAGWLVAREVDRENSKVRFLLLAPGGPVLIESHITVDGQPYQVLMERQLDAGIKMADANQDGKLEWALEGDQISLPGRGTLTRGAPGQMGLAFDLDNDGLASRYEVRRMVCLLTGGPPLVVGQSYAGSLSWETCFQQIADQDRDGTISKSELETLSHRLHLRDANDNELLEPYELLEGRAAAYLTLVPARAALVQLAPDTDWKYLARELVSRYPARPGALGSGEPRLGEMKSQLDSSGDGRLDASELRWLLTAEPQVRVEANMGKADPKPPGAFITSVSDELRKSARLSALNEGKAGDKRQFKLEVPGLRLAVNGQSPTDGFDQFQIQAQNYLEQFDKDENGYLDEKEQKTPGVARLAADWDRDGDGNIYLGEIRAALADNTRLENSRVFVDIMDEPKELFSFADTDRDGRLGPRELAGIRERLLLLDGNGSGELEPEEYPSLLRITFVRGQPSINPRMTRVIARRAPVSRALPKGWFNSMDGNGDHELSAREFLGTAEKFQVLDANHDGLLTETEAEFAK